MEKKLIDLYSSPNIITVTKLSRTKRSGTSGTYGRENKWHRVLAVKPEGM
jgi:hypothetical protein